jgi:hypothetical protein
MSLKFTGRKRESSRTLNKEDAVGDIISLKEFKKEKRRAKNKDFLHRMEEAFIKQNANLVQPLGLSDLDHKQKLAFLDFWEKFSNQAEPVGQQAILKGLDAYETGTYEAVFAKRGEKFGEVWVHTLLYAWIKDRRSTRYRRICDTIALYLTILEHN